MRLYRKDVDCAIYVFHVIFKYVHIKLQCTTERFVGTLRRSGSVGRLYLNVGTNAFKNNLQTYSAENRKRQQINALNGLKKEVWSAIRKRHDGGESPAY